MEAAVQKSPRPLGRSALAFEVDVDRSAPPQWVRFTISRPGLEGAFSRTWKLTSGTLSQSEFEDVQAVILKALLDAMIFTVGGVQQQII